MSPDPHWENLKEIFQAALALAPDARSAYLGRACDGNTSLRQAVESLLKSHEESGFMDQPAYEAAADLLMQNRKLTPGQTVGRYHIVSLIGEGGMGRVYLAEDTKLHRKVSLKFLSTDVTKDHERRRRFEQEARAASALNHPNIITIHEIGEEDGNQFIATEFIDGQTLRERLRSSLDIDEALEIAIQAASALVAAHRVNIIHRDIKPENIMIRKDEGLVKVLDFGLAKITVSQRASIDPEADTQLRNTAPGVVMGTVAYMSPEQARGEAVDERTDIWSLSVVLYEMVAGCSPFVAGTSNEIISAILSKQTAPPLARYAPSVPERLEEIVEKALMKNKDERYQTSKDLLIDLKRLQQTLQLKAASERNTSPDRIIPATADRQAALSKSETNPGIARPASSAKYIVNQISHKREVVAVTTVLLLILVSAFFYVWRLRQTNTNGQSPISSIAVLPFVNASGDPESEYLSEGITDNLINSLSQLPNLKVMSRNSVFRYKGKEADAQSAGQALGVSAVLTGRLLQHGDNLSISVELVDAHDNRHLWGAQYDRKFSDILSMQAQMAREISERLRLRLAGKDEKRLAKQYTENTEAYQLYLKGRFHWNRRSETSVRKGIEYFNRATEIDPNYALAYTGLADSYNVLGIQRVLPPADAYPKAKAAAKKALEIDDSLAEAHTSLARAMADYDWDFAGAEQEYRRAIELNANYPTAHHWLDILLSCSGRHAEALAEAKRAQEMDPLSIIITSNVGWVQFNMGQVDQAIEQERKSLELEPNFVFALDRLGEFYEFKGLYDKAVEQYLKARTHSGIDPEAVRALRETYEQSGMKGYWSKRLEQLKKQSQQGYVSAFTIAEAYVRLGEKDQAFEWLQKALEDRDTDAIKVNPMLESLRSDPRFTSLLQRVGLPK